MSDYGIQVQRAAGKIQIDGTHQNYIIYNSGTETKGVGDKHFSIGLAHPQLATYSLTDTPFFAFNLNDTDGTSIANCVGSTIYTWFDSAVHNAYTTARIATGTVAMDIPWLVLTPPNSVRQHYGLEIFNAAGDSVFASWENYMKLIGSYTFTLAAGAGNTDNTTDVTVINTSNNYFILLPPNFKWHRSVGNNVVYYYSMGMGKTSTTNVRIRSALSVGNYVSGSTAYLSGNCWSTAGRLLELAPVKTLLV